MLILQCCPFLWQNNEQRLKLSYKFYGDSQLVRCQKNCRKQTKLIEYYLSIRNNYCLFGTFISPIYTFSLAGSIIVCMPSQNTNREITLTKDDIKAEMPTLAIIKHLSIHFFPQGRLLSIFRRKVDEPNPLESDIKELIPAPTFLLQLK